MPATLLQFAQVNDAVAATPKKLLKQSVLAEYFRALDESDLRPAVRYAAGRPFPASDERVLNVGWSVVSDVLLSILKLDQTEYHDLVVKSGEIGEALSTLWPTRAEIERPLLLMDLAEAFDDLGAGRGTQRKGEIVRDLFVRCAHPREAAYLAKIIFREMRSGAREGVIQAAIAQAFEKTLSQVQRCQLLAGDLDEVAVLAKNDALDSAQLRLFHPIQFMLATPQETAELAAETLGGRAFFSEDKLDGIRAQVHKSGDRIAIYTRTMDRTDDSFPDVVAAVATIPGEFLLDGEIVPYRDGQVLPFAHIQRRLGRKVLTAKMLRDNPAAFIAFDILSHDGNLLMDRPLAQRRQALVQLAAQLRLLITDIMPVSTTEEITQAFESARARRNEGIVLKDPESIYSPGRRGQWWLKPLTGKQYPNGEIPSNMSGKRLFSGWLKLKTTLPTLDCVVTAAEFGHGKRRAVLSDYTFAVWDKQPTDDTARLVNIGKAYSGLTDAEIAELTPVFMGLSLNQRGRVHLVTPRIVLEIAFDQIQKSNRHASGYALRFPRIKRIRTDKRPEDADVLSRIAELYESGENFGRSLPPSEPQPTLFD